jgi:two-component system, cell cycle sensor histidine kinase and response regulator CckA
MAGVGPQAIMLVDDDVLVLGVLEKMVDALGYRALAAESGDAALDIFSSRHAEIALVLMDLVMPGIDGLVLRRRLADIQPRVKTILMTGVPVTDPDRDPRYEGFTAVLLKPLILTDLDAAIRKALDSAGDPG